MTVLRRVALLSLAILYVAVDPSFADSTFTDDMFNLANYSVTIFKSNPGATITNQQTLTGGNTGAGLQTLYNVPADPNFLSMIGFMNTTFAYDPSSQGAITSINASADKFYAAPFTFNANFFRPLISQGGNFYLATISGSVAEGVWNSFSQTGLAANDFVLFDFTTGTFNNSDHPDFSSGPMELGLASRLTSNFDAYMADIRYDNFRLNIQSVPEPPSALLLLSGMSLLFGF